MIHKSRFPDRSLCHGVIHHFVLVASHPTDCHSNIIFKGFFYFKLRSYVLRLQIVFFLFWIRVLRGLLHLTFHTLNLRLYSAIFSVNNYYLVLLKALLLIISLNHKYSWPHEVCSTEQKLFYALLYVDTHQPVRVILVYVVLVNKVKAWKNKAI